MRSWGRALLVPIVALALWAIPSGSPAEEIVRAEPAALAAIRSEAAVLPAPGVENEAESSTTTSTPAVSETAPLEPRPDVASEVETAATPPIDTAVPETVAETTEVPTTTAEPLSMGDQALLRISYPWRERFPEWTVTFRGPRTGLRALTYPAEKEIDIFVRSSDTVDSLHRVFAHELGHVIDVELNSEADRNRWREQRNLPESTAWWPSAESPDFATGAGDFAEAFAVWESGIATRSTVAGQPTSEDLALLAELSEG